MSAAEDRRRSSVCGEALHHRDELFERDLSVTVGVHLLFNVLDRFCVQRIRTAKLKSCNDLASIDQTGAVLVEHPKGCLKSVLRNQLSFLHGSHHELRKVDETTLVSVDSVEYGCD